MYPRLDVPSTVHDPLSTKIAFGELLTAGLLIFGTIAGSIISTINSPPMYMWIRTSHMLVNLWQVMELCGMLDLFIIFLTMLQQIQYYQLKLTTTVSVMTLLFGPSPLLENTTQNLHIIS